MKKSVFIWVCIAFVLSWVSVGGQSVSTDTSETPTMKVQEDLETVRRDLEELRKDNYAKAMENAERSISLANFMIQVLIGAVALMTGLGIFSYVRTGQIRKRTEEELREIRELKEKISDDLKREFEKIVNLRCDVETAKREAETRMKDVKRIHGDVETIRQDIEKWGKEIYEKKRSVDESQTDVLATRHFVQAYALAEEGKAAEAAEELAKAVELKPDFPQAYFNWGVELGNLGRIEESIPKYRKAIALNPNFAKAYSNWASSLVKLGAWEEAVEKCRKAIELRPDRAYPWFNMACAYSRGDKKAEALDALEKAVQLDPALKEDAKSDEEFKNLWEDEDFKKLVE